MVLISLFFDMVAACLCRERLHASGKTLVRPQVTGTWGKVHWDGNSL
jgi:hypothetical protein